jgi:Outer membrane protein beta-barrel family/TonB-dependent Receptor Plug Domain
MHISPLRMLRSGLLWTFLIAVNVGYGQLLAGGTRVFGKVLSAGDRGPAEFAAVALLSAEKDSVVCGSLAGRNGDFVLDRVPPGNYLLRCNAMGYTTLQRTVEVYSGTLDQDLGDLLLEPVALQLKEAEVVGERSSLGLHVDRRTYHVEKDLSVQGGTAVDVMKNLPGVSVDAEGNVTLRNTQPMIFVDGRPTALTLDQLPSSEIERVEVITNPGAAFDASSSGGVINVVLRKTTKPGWSGTLQGGGGSYGRRQAMVQLSAHEGRVGLGISGNLNDHTSPNDGSTERTDLSDGGVISRFSQSNVNTFAHLRTNARLHGDVQLTNRSAFNASFGLSGGDIHSDDRQDYRFSGPGGELLEKGDRTALAESEFNGSNGQVLFRHTGPKEGREWSADLTYGMQSRKGESSFTTRDLSPSGMLLPGQPQVQENRTRNTNELWSFQFDRIGADRKGHRVEFGAKTSRRTIRSRLDAALVDSMGRLLPDDVLSNDLVIMDDIQAVYASTTRPLGANWEVEAGLRVERTAFTVDALHRGERASTLYPNGTKNLANALFPSFFMSRSLSSNNKVRVGLSRKIDRPTFFQSIPFIFNTDRTTLRVGNPALAPQLSELAELTLDHTLSSGSFFSSLFTKHTGNVITSVVEPWANDPEVLLQTYVNGEDAWTYGWDNTVRYVPRKGTEITLSVLLQYLSVATQTLRNDGLAMNVKLMVLQRLPKDFALQLNGERESAQPMVQGRTIPVQGVDLTATKDLTKKLGVVVKVNDVFNTRYWGSELATSSFEQEFRRRRDVRYISATLTWRIGEQNGSLLRRKPSRQPSRESEHESF